MNNLQFVSEIHIGGMHFEFQNNCGLKRHYLLLIFFYNMPAVKYPVYICGLSTEQVHVMKNSINDSKLVFQKKQMHIKVPIKLKFVASTSVTAFTSVTGIIYG